MSFLGQFGGFLRLNVHDDVEQIDRDLGREHVVEEVSEILRLEASEVHERIRSVLRPLASHYVQSWIAIAAMLLVRSDGSVDEAFRELQALISPKCLAGLWHYDIPLFHAGAKWFWHIVARRPQLKRYLADQFEGSDLEADWEAVEDLLTSEILAGAWHTMFARILPLSREMASLVVDDVLRGGMPALLSMTLEIFVHCMEKKLRLRPVQNWPVEISPEELQELRTKWQVSMTDLAQAAADLHRYNPPIWQKLAQINALPLAAVVFAFLDYFAALPMLRRNLDPDTFSKMLNFDSVVFYLSVVFWVLGILIIIKGSDTTTFGRGDTSRFLLQLVLFSSLAVWYVLRACDPSFVHSSWVPSVRGNWFSRDTCAVLEWGGVYKEAYKGNIYGVVLLVISLLTSYIFGEIVLLRMASALTFGTYEDFRGMLMKMIYLFFLFAVGGVLFNVEYALYNMDVFARLGKYSIFGAGLCAIYICTHHFLFEGGTWNHLGRLQKKKAVMCGGMTALYGLVTVLMGGFSDMHEAALVVFVLMIGCSGCCLLNSSGNRAARGVTLLQ
jgi:uncharacterized membrane protein